MLLKYRIYSVASFTDDDILRNTSGESPVTVNFGETNNTKSKPKLIFKSIQRLSITPRVPVSEMDKEPTIVEKQIRADKDDQNQNMHSTNVFFTLQVPEDVTETPQAEQQSTTESLAPWSPEIFSFTIDETNWAQPQRPPIPLRWMPSSRDFITLLREEAHRYEESGFGQVNVIIFPPGKLLTSKALLVVDYDKVESYTLTHEIIDKSEISHVTHCDANNEYVEDDCLYGCLINKFVQKFGCFHARLRYYVEHTLEIYFP
jgi:hypothetical protein